MRINRRFFQVLSVVALMVVLAAAFRPQPLPQVVDGLDKVLHCLAFLFLSITFLFSFPRKTFVCLLVSVSLAAIIELGQGWLLPARTASWYDFLADMVGIGLGFVFVWCLQRKKT
jgi:VanZ family protein